VDTETFYGSPQTFENVLKGNVAVPDGAVEFVRDVAHHFTESKKAQ
jgi:hypothetical protein